MCLALIEDGDVKLGVMGCPNLPWAAADPSGPRGCLFVAVKGQKAFQVGTQPHGRRALVTRDGGARRRKARKRGGGGARADGQRLTSAAVCVAQVRGHSSVPSH